MKKHFNITRTVTLDNLQSCIVAYEVYNTEKDLKNPSVSGISIEGNTSQNAGKHECTFTIVDFVTKVNTYGLEQTIDAEIEDNYHGKQSSPFQRPKPKQTLLQKLYSITENFNFIRNK